MASWSLAGSRSLLSVLASKAGTAAQRVQPAAILPALRLFARFVLTLAGLGLAVAAVAILAGIGWALLASAGACFILEWVIKDGAPSSGDRSTATSGAMMRR